MEKEGAQVRGLKGAVPSFQVLSVSPLEDMENVYRVRLREGPKTRSELATLNLARGKSVYGEPLIHFDGKEYRLWSPYRSKLSAFITKGFRGDFARPSSKVLYLGAAQGTTVSHVSDMVGENGMVYAIEISPRAMVDLLELARNRKNVAPILADARAPFTYAGKVYASDYLYCDVAQPNQAELFVENARYYLKRDGLGMIAIKARSIDVTADPRLIYKGEREVIEKKGFKVLLERELDPFERDHMMFYARWLG